KRVLRALDEVGREGFRRDARSRRTGDGDRLSAGGRANRAGDRSASDSSARSDSAGVQARRVSRRGGGGAAAAQRRVTIEDDRFQRNTSAGRLRARARAVAALVYS